MSVAVSDRWLLASDAGGAKPIHSVTCTPPGGDPIDLAVDGCVVTKNLDRGPRFEASLTVQRKIGQRTLDAVLTPGALFAVTFGWGYGAGQTETIPMGVYELAQQPRASRVTSIPLALMDQWKRLEECRFTTPVTASSGSRTLLVSTQVIAAIPGVDINVLSSGGSIGASKTWETERTELINDLSRDGGFWAGFAADGTFEIRPVAAPGLPVATYTDGENAKIIDLSTEQTSARLYNAVTVKPVDGQGWSAVTVAISDPNHPRHPDKIGLRPYFMTSPTASNQANAKTAAQLMLPRVVGVAKRIEISTWGDAHREPGDTIETVQAGTWFDGATSDAWLVETVAFDCLTTSTTITARSADDPPSEEI